MINSGEESLVFQQPANGRATAPQPRLHYLGGQPCISQSYKGETLASNNLASRPDHRVCKYAATHESRAVADVRESVRQSTAGDRSSNSCGQLRRREAGRAQVDNRKVL